MAHESDVLISQEEAGAPPSSALTVDASGDTEPSVLPERRLDEELRDESADDRPHLPDEGELSTETVVPMSSGAQGRKVRGRILLMESDVEVANAIVNVLEEAQYEIELAMDAKYGLMLADSFDPEIILLDVRLPGLSGADMKQILRTAPNFAGRFVDIPILYLGEHEYMVKQRFDASPETPMARYVMKPIDPQELRDKVARVFAELQQRLSAQGD